MCLVMLMCPCQLTATCNLQPATFVALGGAQFESHLAVVPICTFSQQSAWLTYDEVAHLMTMPWVKPGVWGPKCFCLFCRGLRASKPQERQDPGSACRGPKLALVSSEFVCLLFCRRLLSNYFESKANV